MSRAASKASNNAPNNKGEEGELDYYGQPVKKEIDAIDIREKGTSDNGNIPKYRNESEIERLNA